MKTAIYPGSFDPATNGHIDVIKRASNIVDKLIVGVLSNTNKNNLFSAEERVRQLTISVKDLPNVEVRSFNGLSVDFAKLCNAQIIIRGLRAVTDFEHEFQMALANRTMCQEVETIFISTSSEYLFLSSSIVKEIVQFGGNIDNMVPPDVKSALFEKYI